MELGATPPRNLISGLLYLLPVPNQGAPFSREGTIWKKILSDGRYSRLSRATLSFFGGRDKTIGSSAALFRRLLVSFTGLKSTGEMKVSQLSNCPSRAVVANIVDKVIRCVRVIRTQAGRGAKTALAADKPLAK